MSGERFDIAKLRKKWAVEPSTQAVLVHPKLKLAELPKETLEDARARFVRLRVTIDRDLPERRELMAPFFSEVEALFARLLEGESDTQALAAALDKELSDIDDLLAVYFFPPRPQ